MHLTRIDTVSIQSFYKRAQQYAIKKRRQSRQQMPALLSLMLQVLKRRRKDGSSLIKVDQLRDGVVLFEDVADAERYSNYLEADNSSQVSFAETSLQGLLLLLMPTPSTFCLCTTLEGLCSNPHMPMPCCR